MQIVRIGVPQDANKLFQRIEVKLRRTATTRLPDDACRSFSRACAFFASSKQPFKHDVARFPRSKHAMSPRVSGLVQAGHVCNEFNNSLATRSVPDAQKGSHEAESLFRVRQRKGWLRCLRVRRR
jgi:hypothetical protein